MSMILYNGKIYLERDRFAEAVYIDGNIIKAVGTSDEMLAHKTADTELCDLGGKTVIPGLNDSHQFTKHSPKTYDYCQTS